MASREQHRGCGQQRPLVLFTEVGQTHREAGWYILSWAGRKETQICEVLKNPGAHWAPGGYGGDSLRINLELRRDVWLEVRDGRQVLGIQCV